MHSVVQARPVRADRPGGQDLVSAAVGEGQPRRTAPDLDAEAAQGHVVVVDPLAGVTREEQVVRSPADHGSQQHPVCRAEVLRLIHDDVPVPGLAGGRERWTIG